MAIIDMQCYLGAFPGALAVRPPELPAASAYADEIGAEMLCFVSGEAQTDLTDGNARLGEALKTDPRFRGWLSLSIHQPEMSQTLARKYLTKSGWVGARFEQATDGDAVNTAGGHLVLNSLRRYGRAVMLTVNSPATLHAAISAAREFHTLRFIVSPQNGDMTSDSIPAIRESINIAWLPCAAYAERDVLVQAIAALGEKRVLWGSDWGRLHPAAALGMINESALTALQRERIVSRNARDLLAHND
ncbi:MAG TPA: amidohydrolase family protein [Abditibacteriaceae bacterium]|jgi:hypothetical protein